jgi:phosphoserine phosphatase RsbU/P
VEAANPAGEFFGKNSLRELLAKTAGLSASEAADLILSSVQRWSAGQDDDLTLLVCDYPGFGSPKAA